MTEVDFSPNEKYLKSYNGTVSQLNDYENLIVWDFYSQKKLRTFKIIDEKLRKNYNFSYDSEYFSGIIWFDAYEDKYVYVYELPDMQVILDTRRNVRSFLDITNGAYCSWANQHNILAVVSDVKNQRENFRS